MSFFQTSDGQAIQQEKEFDGGGGDIEPIPKGTVVLAAPTEAKWDNYEGGVDYISIKWVVMLPEEYKNRVLFQKLQVNDESPKKADKAKRMLVAIDANAGGKLMAAGEEPTDESMQSALVNKMMSLSLEVWEITEDRETGALLDKPITGNWIRAIADKAAAKAAAAANKQSETKPAPAAQKPASRTAAAKPAAAKPAAQQQAPAPGADFDSFDDDIPFAPIGLQEGRMFLHMI